MRLRRLAYPACTAFLALGAACSTTDPGGLPTAQVRLLNGSTQALTLDLIVGGQVVAQGVGADQASSFGEAPSGSQTIVLRASEAGNLLSSLNTTLVPGARYTVMASGTGTSLTPSIASDTGAANPERANIRIINVVDNPPDPSDSSSFPPPLLVDVYISAPGASIDAEFPRMALEVSWPRYSTLLYYDPGSWIVRFTTAGTKTVLAETGSIAIGAGQVRAINLRRTGGGGWTTAVVTEQ
jgi:hypothetical protein